MNFKIRIVIIVSLLLISSQSLLIAREDFSINRHNILKGSIDNQYEIEMRIYYDEDGELTGDYFYERYKKKIKLEGYINDYKITLYEFDTNEDKSAKFTGKVYNGIFLGEWSSLKSNNKYNFKLEVVDNFSGKKDNIYAGATDNSPEEIEAFAKELKDNILSKNKEEVSRNISYPISVEIEGQRVIIRDEAQFVDNFDKIFYKEYVQTLKDASTLNMRSHYILGIRLGSRGQIWFNSSYGSKELKVTAINNSRESLERYGIIEE
ncbi:hypothetical protein [Halonatronum saccharophilum]|uniref:hypothetical protein n=1 Tax=Halonatronum saccharophilum TaxID=150060 RepID=UPI000486F553|nr:hypothetical protein [Halonatronum saccharophilum]